MVIARSRRIALLAVLVAGALGLVGIARARATEAARLEWLAAQAKPAAGIASGIVSFGNATVAEHGAFGEFRTYFTGDTPSLQGLLSGAAVLETGQQIHPPHQHADEEFLYVAKGEGTWSLDGKESPAHEGDLLYVAPWVMHGIKNTGAQPLTFLVFKWNGKGVEIPAKPGAGAK